MTPSKQQGITLIEIMVAVLVLAVGLLAVAGLQASSIRSTYTSMERSMMLMHLDSFAELVRTNPTQARTGAYVISDCTVTAGLGLDQWITDMQAVIDTEECPTVTWDGDYYTVTMAWEDARTSSTNEFDTRIMP